MANLPETSNFDAGIYQLEINDPVEGGESGISNAQAKALANRTKFLYDRTVPRNCGTIEGLNVGTSTGSLTCTGNIVSAVVTDIGNDSSILITLANAMNNSNYLPKCWFESLSSNINDDDDIGNYVFKKVDSTHFILALTEITANAQNITVHIEVYQKY